MPFPTTGSKTELQAVNEILASVGQAPVTTLDQTNPDVAICYDTLLQTSRQVQAEGWSFNREYEYPIQVEKNHHVPFPNNVLEMDVARSLSQYGNKDTIRRTKNGQAYLYDKTAHTFEWPVETLYCDVLWYFDWQDLPIPIQDYIVARAATSTSQRIVGDGAMYQMLQQQESYMRAFVIEYETQQGDYTFFGHPRGGNFYNSYQPYQALNR